MENTEAEDVQQIPSPPAVTEQTLDGIHLQLASSDVIEDHTDIITDPIYDPLVVPTTDSHEPELNGSPTTNFALTAPVLEENGSDKDKFPYSEGCQRMVVLIKPCNPFGMQNIDTPLLVVMPEDQAAHEGAEVSENKHFHV